MKKNNWDKYAPIYNLFMRKDRKAYEEMYRLIRSVVKNKRVLELATGTGLIARNISSSATVIEATDFSEKMIEQATKEKLPPNLHFSVQDACCLPYKNGIYDVVIISNALHIMPCPDRALSEIRRVLSDDGIMIAPTFTHGRMKLQKRLLSKIMSLVGFRTENKWTAEQYIEFLQKNGWYVKNCKILNASFPLTYVECTSIL